MDERDEGGEWTPEMEKMWLRRLDVFTRAQAGELEPLAAFLEEGYQLDPNLREWLVAYLRGKIKWPPGKRISVDQIKADVQLAIEIKRLIEKYDFKQSDAISLYLDNNPDVNSETLKKQLKRGKRYLYTERQVFPRYK